MQVTNEGVFVSQSVIISNLCHWFVSTRKAQVYPLVYRMITLILTLPVIYNYYRAIFHSHEYSQEDYTLQQDEKWIFDWMFVNIHWKENY